MGYHLLLGDHLTSDVVEDKFGSSGFFGGGGVGSGSSLSGSLVVRFFSHGWIK